MDFSNRGSQSTPDSSRSSSAFPADGASSGKGASKVPKLRGKGKLAKLGASLLLIAVAVLMLAVLALSIFPGVKSEDNYVDSSKMQAVFLTNDQVYFGKVKQLNSKFLVLSDIYYLRTQGTDAAAQNANNVSLVKLGCELHKPFDKMVINREQVQFWENLQADGQVANAVKQYAQQNPTNACSNTANGGASSTNVQGSTPAPTTKP